MFLQGGIYFFIRHQKKNLHFSLLCHHFATPPGCATLSRFPPKPPSPAPGSEYVWVSASLGKMEGQLVPSTSTLLVLDGRYIIKSIPPMLSHAINQLPNRIDVDFTSKHTPSEFARVAWSSVKMSLVAMSCTFKLLVADFWNNVTLSDLKIQRPKIHGFPARTKRNKAELHLNSLV